MQDNLLEKDKPASEENFAQATEQSSLFAEDELEKITTINDKHRRQILNLPRELSFVDRREAGQAMTQFLLSNNVTLDDVKAADIILNKILYPPENEGNNGLELQLARWDAELTPTPRKKPKRRKSKLFVSKEIKRLLLRQ